MLKCDITPPSARLSARTCLESVVKDDAAGPAKSRRAGGRRLAKSGWKVLEAKRASKMVFGAPVSSMRMRLSAEPSMPARAIGDSGICTGCSARRHLFRACAAGTSRLPSSCVRERCVPSRKNGDAKYSVDGVGARRSSDHCQEGR